jgi:hypothetical protein
LFTYSENVVYYVALYRIEKTSRQPFAGDPWLQLFKKLIKSRHIVCTKKSCPLKSFISATSRRDPGILIGGGTTEAQLNMVARSVFKRKFDYRK